MKTYGGVGVYIHDSVTLKVSGQLSRPYRCTPPGKEFPAPIL
jgi:hypothetical protein